MKNVPLPYNYSAALELVSLDPPFEALVMAAMRRASTENFARLCEAFPEIWENLRSAIETHERKKR